MKVEQATVIKGNNEYTIDDDGWVTIYGFGSLSHVRELPFLRIPPDEALALARHLVARDLQETHEA